MKLYKKNIVVVALVSFCVSLAYLYAKSMWQEGSDVDGQNQHVFIRPVFAQASGSTFLEQEAGMSIYMKADVTIDLAKAKNVYKNIEKETSEYIVGSLSLPDLPESDDVHCFVHVTGWIVVYYLKTEPISKIIDWSYYTNNVLTKTKLQIGLEKMALALGVNVAGINYYHFQYPYADKWMIVIEVQLDQGEDSFNIKIPSSFTVYERSWIHNNNYGTLTSAQLTPDVFHTIKAMVDYYYSYFILDENTINQIYTYYDTPRYSKVAIILAYKEP